MNYCLKLFELDSVNHCTENSDSEDVLSGDSDSFTVGETSVDSVESDDAELITVVSELSLEQCSQQGSWWNQFPQ